MLANVVCVQKWDPNLKVLAEGYAAKCIWSHNPDLDEIGENLFVSNEPLDLREALEKWFLGESSLHTLVFCSVCFRTRQLSLGKKNTLLLLLLNLS